MPLGDVISIKNSQLTEESQNMCKKYSVLVGLQFSSFVLGSCKPRNDLKTNNNITTNNELSNYSIQLSVQMGVLTGPP